MLKYTSDPHCLTYSHGLCHNYYQSSRSCRSTPASSRLFARRPIRDPFHRHPALARPMTGGNWTKSVLLPHWLIATVAALRQTSTNPFPHAHLGHLPRHQPVYLGAHAGTAYERHRLLGLKTTMTSSSVINDGAQGDRRTRSKQKRYLHGTALPRLSFASTSTGVS